MFYFPESWLIEEYDRILAEEEASNFEWEYQVICPICEKSVLIFNDGYTLACIKCQTQYPHVDSLHTFKYYLDNALRTHDENCPDTAQFALLKDKELGLFLICESCSSFSQVM